MMGSTSPEKHASVYGIFTEEDCKEALEQLLVLNAKAQETPNRETVGQLKIVLHDHYEQGNGTNVAMSAVERAVFFPAIHDSYVKAPAIDLPKTWKQGLNDIEFYLRYYLRSLSESNNH